MDNERAIAIVGLGAILPDAPNVAAFWNNIVSKRYSIGEVPAERWPVADYFDPDIKTPDKTYSKIGGWVRGFQFDWKRFRIPPRVAAAMDQGQQWAVTLAADALADYGYPARPLNTERAAVILGTAMGGELHYATHLRISFPEFARALEAVPEFQALPGSVRAAMRDHWHGVIDDTLPPVTEDTMPGELPNIVSGRVANVLDLHGANFITDAACASSLAALNAAIEMLVAREADVVITGGVDRNMGVSSFVKFCKIGALSATGSRPFGDGADGFVMGEGAAAFLLKRLDDAERTGDKIYAVVRGVGGSSDGRGKSITAPNPVGQQFAIRRTWESAGLDPATASLIEAHGTSTRVGDVVEVESLISIFGGAARGGIALGSVKSNIGHLKAGAGAAGLLKAVLAVHHKVLPPTLNAERPNPNIDFAHSPFYLNHEAREWQAGSTPRRAGVSAYGFGGTNFHVILEEHAPGALIGQGKPYAGVSIEPGNVNGTFTTGDVPTPPTRPDGPKTPPRGILAFGTKTPKELQEQLDAALMRVQSGWTPPVAFPDPLDLRAPERLLIDFGDHDELLARLQTARKAMGFDSAQAWRAMQPQGIFRGSGAKPGKIAFLFPGQGSQYANMGRELARFSPIVAEAFNEADAIMTPVLGRPLTSYIFVDAADPAALMQAELDLMQTAITQPAMLALDIAIYRLLEAYGFRPDMVMGHSLGEYAALIVAGAMSFTGALEAAAARGSEMSRVSMGDNGQMAAVIAPMDVVEATLRKVDGYVVPANLNSRSQCVIGGASEAVQKAMALFEADGYKVVQVPVSHAFHTQIVAPASEPLRRVLDRLSITPPRLPLVANVTGELYPTSGEAVKDMLQIQIASPVQWVKGMQTLYASGVRTFVEAGPKRALKGFADDVFGDQTDVFSFLTCHPKQGELPSFNQALCGLYASGYFNEAADSGAQPYTPTKTITRLEVENAAPVTIHQPEGHSMPPLNNGAVPISLDSLSSALAQALQQAVTPHRFDRNDPPAGSIIISGTGLGLPGAEKSVMAPDNAQRILRGEQFIDLIPERFRKAILAKRITRLIKSEDGSGRFETITDPDKVIKLAGRPGSFDLHEEYGVPEKLIEALDTTTQLAMAAGLDALREAGIPLVQTYRAKLTGKYLPDRWMLPPSLRDETGVIFASAFPGGDRFADEFTRYYTYQGRLDQLTMLEDLRRYTRDEPTLREISRRMDDLREQMEREPYEFDRRFLFRIMTLGHSQFAQYVGARGPSTHVNAACASTTHAIALAEDWIRAGRCRRVIVISGDDVTSDQQMEWIGSGFLAVGAAATDDCVEEVALPFDRRRHGTILGMGACALVIESEDAVRERGMRGAVELLSSETRNSAFHGTRLDIDHVGLVMESLVTAAERRFGLHRRAMAGQMVFMSHETFTPARGGAAAAEVNALRQTFGAAASEIVIANTKGFTGHPMGVGIEDVIAVKILEHGIVPPLPNFKEVDPELGALNLSRGGRYPVQYVLHLAAGFGSQVAMVLTRRIPGALNRIENAPLYRHWLASVSGYDNAETEVVKRVLRVVERGFPPRVPAPNSWRYGTGPVVRTAVSVSSAPVEHPAHMVFQPATLPPAQEVALAPKPEPVPVIRVEAANVEPEQPAPTAPPAAVSTPEPPQQGDPLVDQVLEIVSAQTGYPVDMLDPDLDLEADLGIDTVKQAETFVAIRTAFDLPRRDDIRLRDYPTLAKVIQFVRDSRPDFKATLESSAVEQQLNAPAPDALSAALAAADLVPRRVPVPSLRPPLEWCRPSGVTLDASSRVIVVPDEGGVAAALTETLQKRGVTVLPLAAATASDALEAQARAWLAEGAIQGVYWLPALDVEPALEAMDLAAWRELNRVRVKNLAILMRTLYESFKVAGSFLVSATRLGGLHGYGDDGATAPLGGGVVGFTKAFKRERAEPQVKAVDFAVSSQPEAIVEVLIAETLSDTGVIEVGYYDGNRFTIAMEEQPAVDGRPGLKLCKDTVFVVTGAAGGITSAIVTDLAAASGGVFYLLDLVKLPSADDARIRLFRSEKDALKAQFAEQLKAAGERGTPSQVDKLLLAVEREEAALRVVEVVQAAGGKAYYYSVNLLDGEAVSRVIDDVRSAYGRIDVVIHAAGVEISRSLRDKDQAQFDLIYDIKADGFFSLLRAAKGMPIAATVVFSSVAGRFGNVGQTDYSAANDLLCKVTSSLRLWRPDTRGIAIDWTAWGGIGMATRGTIPRLMRIAGIDMLPPESGVPTVRRELVAGGRQGEVIVALRLGILFRAGDADGGLDAPKVCTWAAEHQLGLIGTVKGARLFDGLEVETTLDPTRQPFLFDHQIEGTPVLPGAMGSEAFAELASVLAPGYRAAEVFNEEFHNPFKFYRHEPATLYLSATAQPAANGDLIAATMLRSVRTLAGDETKETVHFTASVRLTRSEPEALAIRFAPPADLPITREAIYQLYFHGPAYQVMQAACVDGDTAIGLMAENLLPNSAPADAALLFAPRLFEFVFQTAGVWEIKSKGVLALPLAVRSAQVYRAPEAGARLYAVVKAAADGFDAQVVDENGAVYVAVTGYRTVQLPGSVTL